MEKEFDHEIKLTVNQARNYLDGEMLSDDFDNAIDNAQGDAKIKGVAQRILLIVEPDEEAEEAEEA